MVYYKQGYLAMPAALSSFKILRHYHALLLHLGIIKLIYGKLI
jgi:hypothetical protein